MKKFIGLTLFIISVLALIKIGVPLSAFWDLPIFLFVLISSLGLTIASVEFESIKKMDSIALKALSSNLNHSGILGLIVGAIQIMHNLSDIRMIGAPIGICLLSIFYSVLLKAMIATCLKIYCRH